MRQPKVIAIAHHFEGIESDKAVKCELMLEGHPTDCMYFGHSLLKLIMPEDQAWYISKVDYFAEWRIDSESRMKLTARIKNELA